MDCESGKNDANGRLFVRSNELNLRPLVVAQRSSGNSLCKCDLDEVLTKQLQETRRNTLA